MWILQDNTIQSWRFSIENNTVLSIRFKARAESDSHGDTAAADETHHLSSAIEAKTLFQCKGITRGNTCGGQGSKVTLIVTQVT